VGTWRVPSLTAADAIAARRRRRITAATIRRLPQPPISPGRLGSSLAFSRVAFPRFPTRTYRPDAEGLWSAGVFLGDSPLSSFLPEAHRRRNKYLLFTSLYVTPLLMKEPSGFHKPSHKLLSVVAVGDLER
jgi:hypothetical protein